MCKCMNNGPSTPVCLFALPKMTLITATPCLVDDGTAVIECLLRHPTPNTTQLVSAKARGKSSTTKPSSTCTSANSPPYKRPLSTGHPTFKSQISSPLKPVAQVGASVRIQGRVVKRGDNRVILINEIGEYRDF